jgi:formate dehydrogenase subunit gamma
MQALYAAARIALGALALVFLLAPALPALAQQNVPVNPQASVQSEETLLQQNSRVEGVIDQPNLRERVLIQPDGRIWDHFHEVTLHWTSIIVILGMIAILGVAYLIIGRMRISAGRSGTKVRRFSGFERFAHWLTASSFVVLGLTGLNITFGKRLLLPLIGPDAFSAFAQIAKYVHNYVSFAFVLGLALIVIMWMKDNIPRKIDIVWLKEGGGFIRSKHPTAGRFNAGEKLVFWFALGAGAAVAVSGYLLAQVVHSLIAVAFIAVIIAHIYIGTLGMEGAFEAMGTGSVDLNWAKEHHGLWLAEEIAKGRVPNRQAAATPAE